MNYHPVIGLWDTECAILWWFRQWPTSPTIFPCLGASKLAQVLNVFPLSNQNFFGQVECVEWLSYWTCFIFWPGTPLGVAPCPQVYVGLLIRLNVRAGIIGPWQVESITTTAVISWSVLRALVLQASVSGCWALSEFKKKNTQINLPSTHFCLSLIFYQRRAGSFPLQVHQMK